MIRQRSSSVKKIKCIRGTPGGATMCRCFECRKRRRTQDDIDNPGSALDRRMLWLFLKEH